MANSLAQIIKPRRSFRNISAWTFHDADVEGMPKESNGPKFEGLNPPTLFREFAAECMELARTTPAPEKRALPANGERLAPNGAALGEKI